MDKLRKLKEDRGALARQMDTLFKSVPDGKLNAEQLKEYNDLKAKLKELDAQIEVAEDAEAMAATVASSAAAPVVSENDRREIRKYSIGRAIAMKAANKELTGIEKEMHEEAVREAKAAGIGSEFAGFGVPAVMLSIEKHENRDLSVGTATAGGNTVATNLDPNMIPALRPRLKTVSLGATVLTGLTGNLSIPKQTGVAAAGWESENGDADQSEPTFGKIDLSPKRLAAFAVFGKQLLAQSNQAMDAIVRRDLEIAIQTALDLAAIMGTGAANQPTGILNTVGIGSVAGGANGLVPTWGNIVSLETQLATANADVANMAYLTTPGIKGKLKTVSKVAGQNGFIWEGNEMNGYRSEVSTQVPSNLTKGTANGTAHAIIFGNWAELIIGQWAGLDIVVDPYTLAGKAQVKTTINSWWDIAVRHAESFAAMKDALTA